MRLQVWEMQCIEIMWTAQGCPATSVQDVLQGALPRRVSELEAGV